MKNLGAIQDPKSVVNKEYVDGQLAGYRTAAAQDEIDEAQDKAIAEIYESISESGSPVTFYAPKNGISINELKADIELVQAEGTPTPETPLPISGWTAANVTRTGKNILNGLEFAQNFSGYGDSAYELDTVNKTVRFNHQLTGAAPLWDKFTLANNHTIMITGLIVDTNVSENNSLRIVHTDNTFIQIPITSRTKTTYVIHTNKEIAAIKLTWNADAWTLLYYDECGVFDGTLTEADFEPYVGTFIEYDFPSAAGTVYAGTLTINDDGTGELKTRPFYDSYNGETLVGPWVSSMDVYSPEATPTIGAQVVDLGGAETVYPLTAQQVLETLRGTNNIWADCGDVTVSLQYSQLSTIQDELANLRACIAPTEDGATASQAYAAGAYFFRGGNFCKAIAQIASGAAFTRGTNYQTTTVAAELIALQS